MNNIRYKIELSRDETYGRVMLVLKKKRNRNLSNPKSEYNIIWCGIDNNIKNISNVLSYNLFLLLK